MGTSHWKIECNECHFGRWKDACDISTRPSPKKLCTWNWLFCKNAECEYLYLCNFHFFAVQLKHTSNFFVRLIYANLKAARNRNEICVETIDGGRFQTGNAFASVTNWSNKLMKNVIRDPNLHFQNHSKAKRRKLEIITPTNVSMCMLSVRIHSWINLG